MRFDDRRGFTLIELILSLALTGLILLLSRGVLSVLQDTERRITTASATQAELTNGLRLLRDLLARATARGDGGHRFVGEMSAAEFDSWCDTPQGWLERCRVTLVLTPGGDRTRVLLRSDGGATIEVRGMTSVRQLVYLERSVEAAQWSAAWGSSIVAPNAVGLVSALDTLVFAVGLP